MTAIPNAALDWPTATPGKTPPVTAVTEVTDVPATAPAGAALLDETLTYLKRFVSFPDEHHAVAVTLWILHAHAVEAFETSPRCAILSPEPGSGKTRLMELIEALVPRATLSINSTTSFIFRRISDEAGLPTVLLDEVDAVFSGRPGDSSEDLRALLNSGYRRGASAGRTRKQGTEFVTEEFPSFCPVAMAGLNTLPDTLMTRSVIIPMKRRPSGVRLEPYRRRVNGADSEALNTRLADFAASIFETLTTAWPDLPAGVEDRNADVWEPLIALADAAGGRWPDLGRSACLRMIAEANEKPATLGIRLLNDIRTVFADRDRLPTSELIEALTSIEQSPWGNIKGEPIDARFIARQLSRYEIPTNNTFKYGSTTAKGYERKHFVDAWDRYLPPLPLPEIGNFGNQGNQRLCTVCSTVLNDAVKESTHPTCAGKRA
jgi:hypothetical protein